MKYVSQFDLLQIRTRLQAEARRSFDVMNPNGLQAALAAPRQAVFGHEVHSGLIDKAAILFSRLIENHPFYDGNKRIAVEALRLFLRRNQVQLSATDDELLHYARRIVLDGLPPDELAGWMAARVTSISIGEE
jgi:death-on-curing protein